MDLNPDMLEHRRDRVGAAAEIVAFALERDLPHMALGAAREAARSALLALAAGPRRLTGPDLEFLWEVAAAPPQHLAGRPAERAAVMRAMLSAVGRLFPPPPATAGRDRPRDCGAERPSLPGPDRALHAGLHLEARPGGAPEPHAPGRAPESLA